MKPILKILILMVCLPAYSQVQLADIFTDNMVLQREVPINIWGKATPGESVELEFMDQTYETVVAKDSTWQLNLPALNANSHPHQLKVSQAGESVVLENLLVGDVWLLLGQSNMEWMMAGEAHYVEEIPEADNPLLRFYNPTYIGKNIYNQKYTEEQNRRLMQGELYSGAWEESDSTSFKAMSAVGYYFGKKIAASQELPIGLINLAIGGAPLETFLDVETLKKSRFASKLDGNWLENPDLPEWVKVRGSQNVGGANLNHVFRPGYAYKTGIAPLLRFPISGILWYQGESNAQEPARVSEYAELQNLMVADFRKKWDAPELPFYFVQLSSIDTLKYKSQLWPQFRNAQLKSMLRLPHSGMAVSHDHGAKNDVHPRNKKVIGERLARWALHDVYGEAVEVSGPLPKKAGFKNGKVTLSFDHTAGQLKTSDGKEVKGFSINGQEVSAKIAGEKIIISTKNRPEFIQYAWKPYTNANLVNSEDLPTTTFKIQVE